ncbi:tripartite motif-containing protein 59 [Megalops cyprinoides]|uniref:tripartite motif-containing protein 59 n=1 Tax=Megalops cyprinoides TaxID=118141 RepID=UPI001863C49F|nr:tripartite motif-containing protein 59 [Megalops cyprinoides]
MDNLEEDLTCSVCYSLFTDPRVLPCSHTFCKACLDNVLQVSGNFSIWRPLRVPLKCPNCRSVVELPPTGVEALPINVSLRAIIEKYQRDSQPRSPVCPEHPRQPLNVYCVQDRKLICGFCLTIGQHQGHAIDDLQTAYVKEREAPAQLVEQLTDKRWAEVCTLVEQLEQEKARCESLVRQDREAVAQFFQGLERVLARKRDAFMAALDAASLELLREYDPLIEKLKDMKEEQLDLISYSTAVMEEDSPLVYLEKVHMFRERVEALTKTPLPKVTSLYIHPRVSEFLEQHWAGVTIANLEQSQIPRITCCANGFRPKEAICSNWLRMCPTNPASSTILLVLLFLIVVLGLTFAVDPTIMFSILHQVNRVAQSFSHELLTPLCLMKDTVVYLQSLVADLIHKSQSVLSSLEEATGYYMASIYKIF